MKKTPPPTPTPAPFDKQSDKTITSTKPESDFPSGSHQQPTPLETKDKPESKRARALETYKTEMEMIDQIAEGARSQAEENQRKEIKKVQEKADKIRLTGKIPTKTCLCL
ncbi:Remorin, C-terminal [Cynara cardunculus var. scolymus]|uniref:Remorin, C-terminal n=1 Tax=Cynara cardunculus var. scolymus TaxID=59895 RepID=A0A103XSQ9_CYNCS|nr:Remorin, C-terminal [Cynara cardunculus var. scolymus]